jgi:REP element-mobilizing transposase RayT
MPDHVHLVFALQPGVTLAKVMQVWKGHTARELRRNCGVPAPVWQRGYYDHMIRDPEDLRVRLSYIHDNPVRKRMVERAQEYQFSTAHPAYEDDVDRWWMA